MTKRMCLWIAAVMLAVLTACGADKEHEESAGPVGYETPGDGEGTGEPASGTAAPGDGRTEEPAPRVTIPGDETGTKEPTSGVETPGDGEGTEKSYTGTSGSGENAVFPERAYERDIIYYSETSEGYHLRKDVEKTQTDYAVYYFELPIGEQERNACIAATDRMLSRIEGVLPEIEIVVLQQKSYDGVSVSGSRLYLTPRTWDSVDYLARVLLAGYAEWGNYGLAYGYADHLCRKAGSGDGEAGSNDREAESNGREADPGLREAGSFLPMSVPEAYDLNLLCFDERFVSPEDVEAAKNNACLFVEDYLSSHSEEEFLELLSASGTVEGVSRANEALEAFYAENGVNVSLTEVLYRDGGALSDYSAACKYASFYVYRDWQDFTWEVNPMVSENFLHEDYGEVREFFECSIDQMRQYRELFGFESYNDDVIVFFKNDNVVSRVSYYVYVMGKHIIHLESVGSLVHEYIHSLMEGRFEDHKNPWKVEGFATYFDAKYDVYAFDFLSAKMNDASSTTIWIQEYIDKLGRPIDMRTDVHEFYDLMIYAYEKIDPNASYQSGSSFIHYLVGQYGEQAVIAYVCSDNDYNADWDKSYYDLVQEWRKYIKDNYSQYSTNAAQ